VGNRSIGTNNKINKKMTEAYFYKLDSPFTFMDKIYAELDSAIWYESKYKQCRFDASQDLRNIIQEVVPFKIDCCGFFKNEPGWKYPLHRDSVRYTAINILLVEPCDMFNVYFYSDDLKTKIVVPYIKDHPLLINTKKLHMVSNSSPDKIRYVLSIGCIEQTYDEVKKKFQNV
jgi:hypothetical protein